MANQTDILENEITLLVEDLKAKHIELGMKASGNWINTLEPTVKGLKGIIYGAPYTEQLVNGRAPGKFPPIGAIASWIIDKGIASLNDKISVSSLAFLIARKIAREGTNYFKQGGTDLIEAVITPERIQSIIDKVTEFYISDFTIGVTRQLQNLKVA